MRKLLTLALISFSAIIFVPSAEAKTADLDIKNAVEANQRRVPNYQRRQNNRRVRVVTRTRIVRRGYATYREVWQYRYLPNGRVQSRLLSRTRIR